MTVEQLIAAGLTPEQAANVIKIHKTSIDGSYVPKTTFEAERDKVKTLTKDVADRDTQITTLGAFKGTAEDLTAEVKRLEDANELANTQYQTQLAAASKKAAVLAKITGQVVDVDDVLPRLDMDKIVINGDTIQSGLDEQITALKQSKPHYFPTEQPKDTPPSGWIFGKTPADGSGTDDPAPNEAAKFGQQLAQMRTQGQSVSDKAAEHYFK